MKILIVGTGGRESAISWKLSQNEKISKIYSRPSSDSIEDLLKFAIDNSIDLTIVGSEELLVKGIVDTFKRKSLKIFGPNESAALLEGSKAYSKDFMKKYGIRTAKYEKFTDSEEAIKYLEQVDFPIVIKASGLAAGKGVLICENKEDAIKEVNNIMVEKVFGYAGNEIVIEEFLVGFEASILSITDSNVILPFISAKDHKKIGENETGLNTGGMGVIAPNPYMTDEVYKSFVNDIMNPTLEGIKAEGMSFSGVIFFGLMICEKGVYLLEYNMRLGDPETQCVLPLLKSDLLEMIEASLDHRLDKYNIEWSEDASCCIVLASGGYPLKYQEGFLIEGIDTVENHVFLAGAKEEDGKVYTNGGRVLSVVATGATLSDAIKKAYADVHKIKFENMYYRKDIGRIG